MCHSSLPCLNRSAPAHQESVSFEVRALMWCQRLMETRGLLASIEVVIPPPLCLVSQEQCRWVSFWRNCSSGACDACWCTGPWRPCTSACGQGFQSRKVDCVHTRSCKTVAERRCEPGKKPSSWQHCLGPSCDSTYPSQVLRPPQSLVQTGPLRANLVRVLSAGPFWTYVVSWDIRRLAALMWVQLGVPGTWGVSCLLGGLRSSASVQ